MSFARRPFLILVAFAAALCLQACRGAVETSLPFLGEHVRTANESLAGSEKGPGGRHPRGLAITRSLSHVIDADRPDRPSFECSLSLRNHSGLRLSLAYASFTLVTDEGRSLELDRALAWVPATEEYEPAPDGVADGETLELSLRFPAYPRVVLAHLLRLRLSWGYRLGRREYHVESLFRVGF